MTTTLGDPLTDRQQEVLDTIRAFKSEHGYAPSIRDLGRLLGIRSTNGVVAHLRALAKKGAIRLPPAGTERGIVVVGDGLTRAKVEEAAASLFIDAGGREADNILLRRGTEPLWSEATSTLSKADVANILCQALGVDQKGG